MTIRNRQHFIIGKDKDIHLVQFSRLTLISSLCPLLEIHGSLACLGEHLTILIL